MSADGALENAMAKIKEEGVDSARIYELCRELNMDKETEETALRKFHEIAKSFTLEGNPIHWFCCALYAACRESFTPTVGGTNTVVMGNCVSLNKLLRSCDMSIYQFISMIKNWHKMANLSSKFLQQIERLERNFGITIILFGHYNNIFEQLFLCPRNEKRNTKYRSAAKCSSTKLYDLCWCLYLCATKENPHYTVDLVTSYHLLICCIDLIYINVCAENRTDLINPDFKGVPCHWNTPQYNPANISRHCIINDLCNLTDAIPAEVKAMKTSSWRLIIEEFFRTKTINGNEETFLGIVSNQNFEQNLKSLNSAYEQYILTVGEFDERILLSNPNYRKANVNDHDGIMHSVGATSVSGGVEAYQDIKSLIPSTPLTRKQLLPNKEHVSEPVANATNSVKKLQDIVHITEPSDFIKQAGEDALKLIEDILKNMSEQFHRNFPIRTKATERFQLAHSLYLYLLEKILVVELRTKPNIELKTLLNSEKLNTTLIACCVEIVLEAYNSQIKFPWILHIFSINAFDFIKVIEIVVSRHDGILTRELIKHLNFIEETCLESLAWQKSSPIWNVNHPLPAWSEVCVDNMSIRHQPQFNSPMNSAYDTFNAPTVSSNESAKRDLFNSGNKAATAAAAAYSNNAGAAENTKSTTNGKSSTTAATTTNDKKHFDNNARASSLPIFLRKFYKLAWLRMKELCVDLNMGSESCLNKIWTLFEYSITQRTELMKDRHLDQILMCAIYIYIKVGEIQKKQFADIMSYYRRQPQATSNIYREVLIEAATENKEAVYKDIIFFYNNNYVNKMTPYALNFSEKKKSQHDLLLSPHPNERQPQPKKLSNNHFVYIYPMEKNADNTNSPNQVTVDIGYSPRKSLEPLGEKVRRGKRNLPFPEDEHPVPAMTPILQNKMPKIVQQQQQQPVNKMSYYNNKVIGMIHDRNIKEENH